MKRTSRHCIRADAGEAKLRAALLLCDAGDYRAVWAKNPTEIPTRERSLAAGRSQRLVSGNDSDSVLALCEITRGDVLEQLERSIVTKSHKVSPHSGGRGAQLDVHLLARLAESAAESTAATANDDDTGTGLVAQRIERPRYGVSLPLW